jgi:hypothetical protein
MCRNICFEVCTSLTKEFYKSDRCHNNFKLTTAGEIQLIFTFNNELENNLHVLEWFQIICWFCCNPTTYHKISNGNQRDS